ncbi:MAG: peptidase [Cyanobium sp.]
MPAPGTVSPSGASPSGGKARKLLTLLRRAHGFLAPFVLLPLLLTVLTGMGYRLLRDWGGLSRDQVHLLMTLHEGEWLKRWFGPDGETVYVLLNGLGLLWMLGSGAAMIGQRAWQRLRPRPAAKPPNGAGVEG